MLQLGVLGVGGDAGEADQVALAGRQVEHGEGRGSDCGVYHVPSVSKPSHNLFEFTGSF